MLIVFGILFAIGGFLIAAQNKTEEATGSKTLGCLAVIILIIIISVIAEIVEN